MKKLLLCFLLLSYIIFPQGYKISGNVTDKETGNPLPFTNIRIDETTNGTASNLEGKFTLTLKEGEYKLIFSYIGYKPQRESIRVPLTSQLLIKLEPEAVKLQEIVVSADEDPAYRIVREAIKRKKQNRMGLVNFEYDSYSKDIVFFAGEVALIEEVFAKGYNKINEWEKEIVLSLHKTENLKKNMGAIRINVSGKYFIDFSAETISVMMNTVFLPLADNAFDHYDYKLLKVLKYDEGVRYLIQVIPKSKIQPLLKGEILIDDKMYALNEIHLENNEGIIFPYTNNLKIKYSQQLAEYSGYYLPYYVKIESGLEVNLGGLIRIEPLSMNQVNVITNYKINTVIPDSIATSMKPGGKKLATIKPIELSRVAIDSLRPMPLALQEEQAYAELDSTKSPETRIKISGPLAGLIPKSDGQKSETNPILKAGVFLLSKTYFRNNRVDGFVIGAMHSDRIFNETVFFDIATGYSFGKKSFEGNLLLSLTLKNSFVDKIETSLFHEPRQWQVLNPYPDLFNSISVLLGFEDQFNYYLSTGYSIGVEKKLLRSLSIGIDFIQEKEESLPELKYQSIFNSNRLVRTNPKFTNGFDRRTSLSLLVGENPQNFQITPQDGFIAQFDISHPSIASDFNYQKFRFIGQIRTKTIYEELLVAPYMVFMVEGGFVIGDYGPQHTITPNSALSFYSPFGTMKLLKPYQYTGDKMLALHAEHNWRTIPFQAVGLNFITDLSIDLLTGVSFLKMWNESNYFKNNSLEKPYWETYISLSRISGILRIDLSYNSDKLFGVRAALAVLF